MPENIVLTNTDIDPAFKAETIGTEAAVVTPTEATPAPDGGAAAAAAPATTAPDATAPADPYKEVFGEVTDKAVLEEIKTKAAGYEDLKKQVEELSKRPEKAHQYSNDYVKGLDEFLAKGGSKEVYDNIQTADFTKMSDRDVVRLEMKLANEFTDEETDVMMRSEYPIAEIPEDADDDEKARLMAENRETEILQKAAARKARKALSNLQVETAVPDAEKAKVQAENDYQKKMESWNPHLKKIVDDNRAVTVKFFTDADKKASEEFAFSVEGNKELEQVLAQDLKDLLQGAGVGADEKSIAAVNEAMKNRLILRTFDNIIQKVYDHAKATLTKSFDEKRHNPSAVTRGDAGGSGAAETKGDPMQAAADSLFELQKKRMTTGA